MAQSDDPNESLDPPLGLLGRQGSDRNRTTSPSSTALKSICCRTVAKGRFQQRHHIRDLPPSGAIASDTILREDVEPSPMEALLAALGACLSMSIHANAVARSVPIRHLEVHLEGKIDAAALWKIGNTTPGPLGFDEIKVRVLIDAEVPDGVLQALVTHATLWSPVANTLYNPIHLDVVLAEEEHASRAALGP